MSQATVAEILVAPKYGRDACHPRVPFGELFSGRDQVAVAHRDERGRVPQQLHFKLHPRLGAVDMWGQPRTEYFVRVGQEAPLEEVLGTLTSAYDGPELLVKGVHRIVNPGGQVVQTVLPHEFRGKKGGDPEIEARVSSVFRSYALARGQSYLAACREATLLRFRKASSSCEEKLRLLDELDEPWTIDRIYSAHYFRPRDRVEDRLSYVVLVGPELGLVPRRDGERFPQARERFVSDLVGYPVRYAEASELPPEMEHGTCTPFVEVGRVPDIERMVLLNGKEDHDDLPADFSIGGRGVIGHVAGLQVSPGAARRILRGLLGGKLLVTDHPAYVKRMYPGTAATAS